VVDIWQYCRASSVCPHLEIYARLIIALASSMWHANKMFTELRKSDMNFDAGKNDAEIQLNEYRYVIFC